MELIPADRNRCQAEKPNLTWSFMNLGPAYEDPVTGEKRGGSNAAGRMWRCRNRPECVLEEAAPGKDGLRGEMALCGGCYLQLCFQTSPALYNIKEDLRKTVTDGHV